MPLSAETLVIAALGDSLTAGYGLAPEEGFVPVLEAWLQDQGADVRLVNAGVSGDTTAGGLSRLDWTLTPEVEALIVTLGGNDLLRGLPVEEVRANLDAILDGADARGLPVLLIGMKAPGNFGAEYQAAFDAIYPDLAAEHGALLEPWFFGPLIPAGGVSDPSTLAPHMQADGIHPLPEAVRVIAAGIGPKVLDLVAKAEGGQ